MEKLLQKGEILTSIVKRDKLKNIGIASQAAASIWLQENYLDPQDFTALKVARSTQAEKVVSKNRDRFLCNLPKQTLQKFKQKIKQDVLKFQKQIQSHDNLQLELLRLAVYQESQFFAAHRDNLHYESGKEIPRRKISGVYVLQQAAQGGQLLFNGQNLSATENCLFLFDSNCPHEVTRVEVGERKTLFFFYSLERELSFAEIRRRIRANRSH